jgi:hypothetical protein
MSEEKDILSEIKEASAECEEIYSNLYDEMEEDLLFYSGSQWGTADANNVSSTHNKKITINWLKKQVDTLVGRREATLTDLKCYPIENDDAVMSSISTRLLKWTLDTADSQIFISQAYKNQIAASLGWVFIHIDSEKNIRLSSESPLNVYVDPLCHDLMGLSDADYILRFKSTDERSLTKAFPDKADEIKGLKDVNETLYRYETNTKKKRKSKVVIKEYWYRSEETRTWIVNTEDPTDAEVWPGEDDETLTYFLTLNPHLTKESRTSDVIKVATIAGDILLQDAVYCTGSDYPFIPFVGYYTDSLDEWENKLISFIRPLKDIQREGNARHSALWAVTSKLPFATWIHEEGSISDNVKLKQLGGKVGSLPFRKGATPPQLVPQSQLPQAEIQLLQLLGSDANLVGLSPEITGNPSNLESAKAISLVQAVGLTSCAEINSHLNYALKKLGLFVLKLITENYSLQKMQRIIGNQLIIDEATYSALRDDIRFNVVIDETAHSVTHQMAAYDTLVQQAQYGDLMIQGMLTENNPYLTPEQKQSMSAKLQQAQEQQMQMQQQQIMAQMPQNNGQQ